jgi:hypothetical protein
MVGFNVRKVLDKQTQVVLFSSTAIALYGYDQGMHGNTVFPLELNFEN